MPDEYCIHLDRKNGLVAKMFGLFALDSEAAKKDLPAKIDEARAERQKQNRDGVFLIVEGSYDSAALVLKSRADVDDFAATLDALRNEETRAKFRPIILGSIAALASVLSANATKRIRKVGDVIYLTELDTKKPIYNVNFQMHAVGMAIAAPPPADTIKKAKNRVSALLGNTSLMKISDLLVESLEMGTDDLRTFIAIWAALEVFINAMFDSLYRTKFFDRLGSELPEVAKQYVERLKALMKSRDRLGDKFRIIASMLNANEAETDIKLFSSIKRSRDKLFHPSDTRASAYPVQETQNLLLRYLAFHLEADTIRKN